MNTTFNYNDFILYYVGSFTNAAMLGFFSRKILGRKTGWLLYIFATYGILGIAGPALSRQLPSSVSIFIGISLAILYFFTMFNGSLKRKLLAFLISYGVLNVSGILPFYMVGLLQIEDPIIASLIYEAAWLLFGMAILYLIIKIWDSIDFVMNSPKFLTFFLLPLSQVAASFLMVYFLSHNPVNDYELTKLILTNRAAVISFSAVMIISIFADGMFLSGFKDLATGMKEREQLEALKSQNKLTYDYIKSMESDVEGMNRYRHDMLNLMTTLRLTLEKDTECGRQEALSLLDELTKKVSSLTARQYSRSTIVNCVLSFEEDTMNRDGITCEFGAEVPEKLGVNELDLCRLLVNILDNAGESCRRVKEKENRSVSFNMRVDNGWLYIVCRNSRPAGEISFETTKENSAEHGYGMKIMRELTERNGGELIIDDGEDAVTVTATMRWDEERIKKLLAE